MYSIWFDDYDYCCNGDPIPVAPCAICKSKIEMAPVCVVETASGQPVCEQCLRPRKPKIRLALQVAQITNDDILRAIHVLVTAGLWLTHQAEHQAAELQGAEPNEPAQPVTVPATVARDSAIPF